MVGMLEGWVVPGNAERQLMHVRLAQDNGASLTQSGDDGGIFRRDEILERQRANESAPCSTLPVGLS